MGLTALQKFLSRHRRVALDSSIFICHLEHTPLFAEPAGGIFRWLERSPHSAVTSTLTMTEVLVHPYRLRNDSLVNRYYGLLLTYPNLQWIAPDVAIADLAARLRAGYRLRTPDALQLATAIRGEATAFLTNDSELKRVTEIEIAILANLWQLPL